MSMASYADVVSKLRDQYNGNGVMHAGKDFHAVAGNDINNAGFMGAGENVCHVSLGSIVHEAPGCVAAPRVNLIAKKAIKLGMAGQGSQPVPVRIYAPEKLLMTTNHLSIGAVQFLVTPEYGSIFCKKLTLSKTTHEDPDHFEIVKSWVMNDDAEVEVTTSVASVEKKAEGKK